MRIASKLINYTDFTSTKDTSVGGKGLGAGKGASLFDYFATIQAMLCQGPIAGTRSIWDQAGQLAQLSATEQFVIPNVATVNSELAGATTYAVQNSGQYGFDHGVSHAADYSLQANDFGSPGTTTISGTQQVPMSQVTGVLPQPGQYSQNGQGVYFFNPADAGKIASITYSFSLYYSESTEAAQIPFASPFAFNPANQQFYHHDVSVVYVNTGKPLTKVDGSPGQDQYSVDGSKVSGGTYTFSAADAGKNVYVTYTFTSSDSRFTSASKLNLTVFTGAPGQQPWSYMASKHPSLSLAYPTIAYVASSQMSLGTSAVLPSYNYEVLGLFQFGSGIIDALPTDAMLGIFTNPIWGAGYPAAQIGNWTAARNYLLANNFFISANLNSPQSAASICADWLKAGNIGAYQSEGVLKLVPYGDTTVVGNGATYIPQTQPVYSFVAANGDFLPLSGTDDPVKITRSSARDANNYLQVQWTDRTNGYNNALTIEQDDNAIRLYGFRADSVTSYDFITNQQAATFAGQCKLARNIYIRDQYQWVADHRKGFIEPMNIVQLTDGLTLVSEPVRVISKEEAVDGSYTFTAEQFPWGASQPTTYNRQAPTSYQPNNSLSDPGPTTPYIFETTTQELNGLSNILKIAASGNNNNWGGCRVWASLDNVTYNQAGTILGKSPLGVTTADLPVGVDPDTTNTLSVDMTLSGGVIDSVPQSVADSFLSLCAVLDAGGVTLELMSYDTATLTAPNRYTLSYLRRGIYSSGIADHPAGSRFVLLDDNTCDLSYFPQFVGQQLWLKFTSFNNFHGNEQLLMDVPAFTHVIQGTTLGAPAPGNSFITPSNPVTSTSFTTATVAPFTNTVGSARASCLPGGSFIVGGLTPSTFYYIYYIDFGFTGGNITPIATQNVADYQSRTGYYLIGTVTTL
jgi:hypothetical protein